MDSSQDITSLLIGDRIAFGAFDFDGNILAPETPIYVLDRVTGEEIAISGHMLDKHPELLSGPEAPYRWHDDIIDSLIHFRDYHSDPRHRGPDKLKEDIERAISEGAIAPSFSSLKELFLIPARFLSIITSRGHGPDNLARILWMINEALLTSEEKKLQHENILALYAIFNDDNTLLSPTQALRYYFEQIVSYYPVSNPHVAKYLSIESLPNMSERKVMALKHALKALEQKIDSVKILDTLPLSIGFSDDSLSNILIMKDAFLEMKREEGKRNHSFHLYFTGKRADYTELKDIFPEALDRENMLVLKV